MAFLVWLAVLPGIVLMARVYSKDKKEKEPLSLLLLMAVLGAVSVFPIGFLESCFDGFVLSILDSNSLVYKIIENFIIVALLEEIGKFFILERCSWNHKAFNYVFDGIVYAVATGMGFAIAENIMYVTKYGFENGILRALTAVPAHAIFAIFMGHYYGLAKQEQVRGDGIKYNKFRKLCILVPIILHGIYDVVATIDSLMGAIVFFVFVIGLDIVAIARLKQYSMMDEAFSTRVKIEDNQEM